MMAKLYLIPTTLTDDGNVNVIPSATIEKVKMLRCFMVEEEKVARRFLRKIDPSFPLQDCEYFALNEHTAAKDTKDFFETHLNQDIGIISESGCPCVADPGADVVLLAHRKNMEVIPLIGPSSIILALMASGLNGQNFAFNGYLPKEKSVRIEKIKALEKRSQEDRQTQIFMETPYHNQQLLEDFLSACHPSTLVCVASDLTGEKEYVKTLSVQDWRKQKITLEKKPALFLIQKK